MLDAIIDRLRHILKLGSHLESQESQHNTNPKALEKPTRELRHFSWWLKNSLHFNPDIVIDVGAASGTPPLSRILKDSFHYAFEPLPHFKSELENELRGLEHEIHNVALMEEPGVMEITVPDNLYTASLMAKDGGDGKKIEVEVSTLDNVFEEKLEGKKVLLKTDCQGGDLSCIKGGKKTLQYCDVIIMEVSLYRFWGHQHPDFYDIVHHMKNEGFVVFDILGGVFKPTNRALGQVDLAFVKEDGPLRPNHHW